MFRTTESLLNYVLYNPYRQFDRPLVGWKYVAGVVQYWLIFVSILLIVGGQLWYIYDGISVHFDMLLLSYCINWVVYGTLTVESMLMIGRNTYRIQLVLKTLRQRFEILQKRLSDETIRNFAADEMKVLKYFIIVYRLTIAFLVLSGPIWMCFEYLSQQQPHLESPMLIKYPFQSRNIYLNLLTYVWEVWGTIATSQFLCGYLALLGTMATHNNLNFQMLIEEFKSLQCQSHRSVTEHMLRLSREHDQILKIANEIQNLYSLSLLINYVLNSIAICMLIFVILNSPDPIAVGKALTVLIAFYGYNTVFSYYGNELMIKANMKIFFLSISYIVVFFQSEYISYALYDSDWTATDVNHQKLMIMIMRRASQPVQLTGLGFFVVSIESFSKVYGNRNSND